MTRLATVMLGDETFPADWRVIPGNPPRVATLSNGVLPLGEATVLRDILTTRSRSVDRDKTAVRPLRTPIVSEQSWPGAGSEGCVIPIPEEVPFRD